MGRVRYPVYKNLACDLCPPVWGAQRNLPRTFGDEDDIEVHFRQTHSLKPLEAAMKAKDAKPFITRSAIEKLADVGHLRYCVLCPAMFESDEELDNHVGISHRGGEYADNQRRR